MQARIERNGRSPLVATFGEVPLKRAKGTVIPDRIPIPAPLRRKELIIRLLAGRCELCQHTGSVEVHHVGKLAHLGKPGHPKPAWAELMARKHRKTLIVCAPCHQAIHGRKPATKLTEKSLESPVR